MTRWTDQTDREAAEFFPTLTVPEIRRRQDLCRQQQALCYAEFERNGRTQRNDEAAEDLQRMEQALTREMLRRYEADLTPAQLADLRAEV